MDKYHPEYTFYKYKSSILQCEKTCWCCCAGWCWERLIGVPHGTILGFYLIFPIYAYSGKYYSMPLWPISFLCWRHPAIPSNKAINVKVSHVKCWFLHVLYFKLLHSSQFMTFTFLWCTTLVNFSIHSNKASLIWTERTKRNVLTWPDFRSRERERLPQRGKCIIQITAAVLSEKLFSICFSTVLEFGAVMCLWVDECVCWISHLRRGWEKRSVCVCVSRWKKLSEWVKKVSLSVSIFYSLSMSVSFSQWPYFLFSSFSTSLIYK